MPISRGSTPAEAEATIRARGVRPSSRTLAPEATSRAAAPSFSEEEFPAVTDPLFSLVLRAVYPDASYS